VIRKNVVKLQTINFLIDADKKRQLKHLLADKNVTLTTFLIDLIDKEIVKYGKECRGKTLC
jgi:DNA-dependent RNA polymerase auxiliary subunit epsilon